jgi:hypothetical protein
LRCRVKRIESTTANFEFPANIQPKSNRIYNLETVDLSFDQLCEIVASKYDKYAIVFDVEKGYSVHAVWYNRVTNRYDQSLMTGHWEAISPNFSTPEEAIEFAINADQYRAKDKKNVR